MYPRPVATDEPLPVRRESWPKPAHDWNEAWRQIAWPTVNETDPSYWEIWPRMLHYRGCRSTHGVEMSLMHRVRLVGRCVVASSGAMTCPSE
jgi:hypothetical protein